MNQSRCIAEAKRSVTELHESGYVSPVVRKDIKVLGRTELGALYSGIHAMNTAGYATDHDALVAAGFVSPAQDARHGPTIGEMIGIVLSHVETSRGGLFDFADRSFIAELRERAAPILADRDSWRLPPVGTLFVQRKISGTALLCVQLKARLPLLDLLARYA